MATTPIPLTRSAWVDLGPTPLVVNVVDDRNPAVLVVADAAPSLDTTGLLATSRDEDGVLISGNGQHVYARALNWRTTVVVMPAPAVGGGGGGSNPLAAPVTGQVKIATAGAAVQLPSISLVNGLVVKASVFNAAQTKTPAYSGMVGGAGVTTLYDGTGPGYPLAPGEGVSLAIANANQVYVNGTAGDVFTYSGN